MKEKLFFQLFKRMFLLCLLSSVGIIQGWAFHITDEYQYTTHVNVSPTGKGTVYVNYTESDVDNSNNTTDTEEGKDYSATLYSGGNTTTISLNATPIDGWRFLRWEDGDGNTVGEGSSAPIITLTHTKQNTKTNEYLYGIFYNYTYTQNKVYNYTAYFAENGTVIAKVQSGQESIGSAIIREQSFGVGDVVHLVASTINSSEVYGWYFDHWEREDGIVVENKENKEIAVTVTDDKVTYIAVFARVDTENYCFFRNKGTGKYLKIIATNNYSNPTDDNPVGSLNGSFKMVEEATAISDPGCVFMVTGSSGGQGLTNLKQVTIISQGQAVGRLEGAVIINKPLAIRPASSSTYYISFTGQVNSHGQTNDITLYFRDNNGNDSPDLPSTATDENSQWEMLMLNKANIGTTYFGLAPNAALKMGNKYYTTLYTTFPYELQSGTAYYVNDQSIVRYGDEAEGKYRVVCQKVSGNQVPANSAVIIECDGTSPNENKILPLPQSTQITALSGHQLLHGYTKIQHGAKAGDGLTYVLSVGKSSGLGFYKLNQGIAMADNKVYSTLSAEAQQAAKSVTFSFGADDFDNPTEIQEMVMPEDIAGQAIFDLQGRKVINPSNGIYIVNGKKLIIK